MIQDSADDGGGTLADKTATNEPAIDRAGHDGTRGSESVQGREIEMQQ